MFFPVLTNELTNEKAVANCNDDLFAHINMTAQNSKKICERMGKKKQKKTKTKTTEKQITTYFSNP